MSNMIPLTGMDTLEFVPSAFEGEGNPPTFFIRIPTFAIRDKMAAILFQRGLIPAVVSMGRAILIDALYDLYEEVEAEDAATFLEGYWSKADVYEELLKAWQIREAQRIFDVTMVKKGLEQEPLPTAPYTMRDQARQARIISDALTRHEGYRSFQARFMVQQEEEEEVTVQLFLLGWKNCVTKDENTRIEIVPQRDEADRLTPDCVEGLRHWLAREGAPAAWDEIKNKVKEQFGAPGRLEKNSDSLLDMNSSLIGSQTSSGDSETSGGSSTTSSTTPTPATRSSQATSGASRRSRSGKSGKSKTAERSNGQTDAVS